MTERYDRVEIVRAKNGYVLTATEEESVAVVDFVVADSPYSGHHDEIGRLVVKLLNPGEENE